jgi:hypothetical protein
MGGIFQETANLEEYLRKLESAANQTKSDDLMDYQMIFSRILWPHPFQEMNLDSTGRSNLTSLPPRSYSYNAQYQGNLGRGMYLSPES